MNANSATRPSSTPSRIVILGSGTAGTVVANKLRSRLDDRYSITIVDKSHIHLYQPGFLFIPFGTYEPSDVIKLQDDYRTDGVDYLWNEVVGLDAPAQIVILDDGTHLPYDLLVIATGTHPEPTETPGLASAEYGRTVHDFYTLEGSIALRDALARMDAGRLIINLIELPIKCPVAPLEFAFLADAFFTDRGIRDDIDIVYVTPMGSAFTKPVAAKHLGDMFERRDILLEPDFYLERVDTDRRCLVSYDEREVEYDMLVTIPVNMGAPFVAAAGIGDELRHVRVDPGTMQSLTYPNIFAVGDAASLPTSKAGSVVHFSMDTLIPNLIDHLEGRLPTHRFDGHANCYIETGYGKAMLIDFNYETEPYPGKYPLPGVGPFSLLDESEMNHWGKLMFKWMYWHLLLRGKDIPVPSRMTLAGKDVSGS
jgi:sulfide:quinone oxidoreductase